MGELLGLTWQRVHLGDDPHIYVVEQVYKGKRKRLKTDGSERTIPLSPLMARRPDGMEGHDRLRGPGQPRVPLGGRDTLGYSNVYNRVLQPALKACGLNGQGIAFRAFRKACGSMLLKRAGKDPRQVQRWLAHSQLMTTMNVYVTDLDDGLGGADELDGLWGHRGATDHPQAATNGTDAANEIPLSNAASSDGDAVAADSREGLD